MPFEKKGGNRILNQIINLIYPPKCGICGKINNNFLCNKCKIQLEKQAKFEIEKNQNANNYFQEHLYIFEYQGMIRDRKSVV